jgi:hypothetical protein
MGGKAKPTKHTAKELAKRAAASSANVGGGNAGAKDRAGGAAGHAKFECPSCGMRAPSVTTAKIHWEAKHPKLEQTNHLSVEIPPINNFRYYKVK